ncbi:putative secondary metabolism biosynthetic enzyme [Diatrype stigma]|uniref:Secondary metabolism biosynthetic enzyme n=1 Tax=Diatrype stigma TaxID=117547 RepID=A0AAN9YUZ2_9PEZI
MGGAIPYGNVVITPATSPIPTAQAVVDALKQTPADVALLVPSVVAELAQNPDLLDYCAAHLEAIIYIGGDLPQDIGDRVAAKVYLRCLWGATEAGIVPQLLPPELHPSTPFGRSLWRYIRFHPCVGAIFDPVAEGVHELVIRRDKTIADTQPCFTIPGLDQLEEYRTKDLFEQHPSIPDLWRWRARADDIIVFLNGEKTNPISMEQHIMGNNPELSGALVIGAQRFQAALLIEPVSKNPLTTAEQAALIERIWPSVDEANRSAPAHARVEKSFILVVPPDRPFIRAGKGTFMRGPSISQYNGEIERLYANADIIPEDHEDRASDAIWHTPDLDAVADELRQQICTVTGWSELDDDDSFFDRGMDSLQGLQLTRALRRTFRHHDFALSTVYKNPSISQLASAIVTRKSDEDEIKTLEALLATYRGLIQQIPVPQKDRDSSKRPSESINILLTGSTGTVGTYLLFALLECDKIGRVFCLNRRDDGGRKIQHERFAALGLPVTRLMNGDNPVTFIKAVVQGPSLGLDNTTYEMLRTQVDLVIDAAWPVNFNLALTEFRPQLAGLVNLLSLAAASTAPAARVVFISSIAAVGGHTDGPPPEEVLSSLETPAPLGYGRAKFLAELLMDAAAQHLGHAVPTTIVRIGQVAGPVRRRGLWNPREWFPSMVLSSLHLGQVPDNLGPRFDSVDLVPVDILADVIVELVTATEITTVVGGSAATTVFNIRNANIVPWRSLLPAVTDATVPPLQVVSPATWLAALRTSCDMGDTKGLAYENPAIKLLDFFGSLWVPDKEAQGIPPRPQAMSVERALAASPALRRLEPIRIEWMRKWVEEWLDMRKKRDY